MKTYRLGMNSTRAWIAVFLVAALSAWSAGAQTVVIDSVSAVNGRPGMNINAHYDLGKDFTWCDAANIRWIQNVHVTDNKGNDKSIGGFPSNFLDPLPGQSIGNDYNGNAQTGDTLPWYDVTRNQAALTGEFQRGAGAFFQDGPGGAGFNDNAPISVFFNTLVVCTDPTTMKFSSMGGFSWGFTIDPKNANPTVMAVTEVDGNTLIDSFNALIMNGVSIDGNKTKFEQWTMVRGDPNCKLTLVPEPAGMLALGFACLLVVVCRHRSKHA